jgi:hypothetical protein
MVLGGSVSKPICILLILFTGIFGFANQKIDRWAIPFLDENIVIDGQLSESVYNSAYLRKTFYQIYPGDNIVPTTKTELFLFVNKKGIVISFRCFEKRENISTVRQNRDSALNWDYVSIQLDVFGTGKQFYFLAITPANDVCDGVVDNSEQTDLSFDIVFEHETVIKDNCWQAEILIPFSSLSLAKSKKQTWLFSLIRNISNKNIEQVNIVKADRNSKDIRDGMVYLDIKDFDKSVFKLTKKFKFIPSLIVSKVTSSFGFNGDNDKSDALLGQAGLTLEYAPEPSTLLKATIHPDFSQVEADGSYQRVNTRYPIYLQEKRPFFMDGQESFNTFFNLFYSRNIVQPEYGLKFFSKTKQNIGINYIAVMEKDAYGDRLGYSDKNVSNAYWNIFRITNSIDKKGSTVGVTAILNNFGSDYNLVSGIDGDFKFNKFSCGIQGVVTKTKSGKENKSGSGLYLKAHYLINQYLSIGGSVNCLSPDFNNVAGFYNRVDAKSYSGSISYYFQPANDKTFIKGFGVNFGYNLSYNYKGEMLDQVPQLMIYGNLSHQINFHCFYSVNKENYRDNLFDVDYLHTGVGWYENSLFSPSVSYAKGKSVLYIDNPYVVNMEMISVSFSSQWNGFSIEPSYFVYKLKDRIFSSLLRVQKSLNVEMAYFFNKYVNFKVFLISDIYEQRDSDFKMPYKYLNFLFTWQKNAFTKFYLGYNTGDRTFKNIENIQWGYNKDKYLFIKVTWLF